MKEVYELDVYRLAQDLADSEKEVRWPIRFYGLEMKYYAGLRRQLSAKSPASGDCAIKSAFGFF